MKAKKETEKTNVARLLEQKKIPYTLHCYKDTGAISGSEVAKALGKNPRQSFKTLVAVGKSKEHYVFAVPVDSSLDLKKGALTVGEKSIEMIPQRELLPLTGYIHGGCSPIGMKKQFKTVMDISALDFDTVFFSAGKIGYSIEATPLSLQDIIPIEFKDIKCD